MDLLKGGTRILDLNPAKRPKTAIKQSCDLIRLHLLCALCAVALLIKPNLSQRSTDRLSSDPPDRKLRSRESSEQNQQITAQTTFTLGHRKITLSQAALAPPPRPALTLTPAADAAATVRPHVRAGLLGRRQRRERHGAGPGRLCLAIGQARSGPPTLPENGRDRGPPVCRRTAGPNLPSRRNGPDLAAPEWDVLPRTVRAGRHHDPPGVAIGQPAGIGDGSRLT
jgi:hypothetical protein